MNDNDPLTRYDLTLAEIKEIDSTVEYYRDQLHQETRHLGFGSEETIRKLKKALKIREERDYKRRYL